VKRSRALHPTGMRRHVLDLGCGRPSTSRRVTAMVCRCLVSGVLCRSLGMSGVRVACLCVPGMAVAPMRRVPVAGPAYRAEENE
jgi:hypothetical protein